MAYSANHPSFIVPENPNVKLWRYMDLIKLISILEFSELMFVRSDKFIDPYEGYISSFHKRERMNKYKNLPIDKVSLSNTLIIDDEKVARMRSHTYINCWHINDFESAAMWDLYSYGSSGVAIQTTFGRLAESFKNCGEVVLIGNVQYIDFDNNNMTEGNIFHPFIHKRKSFAHENEIRAIISDDWIEVYKGRVEEVQLGKAVKIDLPILIDNIYLSPTAPEWIEKTINAILKRYTPNFNLIKSQLYTLS